MQPREIFVIDIKKTEAELLAEMKSKTRYNIRLAEKKGVIVKKISNDKNSRKYIDEFLRLTKIMAKRQRIAAHPEEYYRKMFETMPGGILKLYIAEYKNEIVAANLVVFYSKVTTYLHGASDDKFKNLMAPYLLQWKQIKDAKLAGCEKYDFGGIKTQNIKHRKCLSVGETGGKNSWGGITRFKLGFSPNTLPVEFPGSYDIIVNGNKYRLYRALQKIRGLVK